MISRALFRAKDLLRIGARAGPVLGLDTGTPTTILGIVSHGEFLGGSAGPAGSHGGSLPGEVTELLEAAGLQLSGLAAIAIGIGPGSFTGLRIGLSWAKGVGWACGYPLVGVPSLDRIAVAADALLDPPPGDQLCPLIDARRGEAYWALYGVGEDGLDKQSVDSVVNLRELVAKLVDDVTFVVEGDEPLKTMLNNVMGGRARVLDLGASRAHGQWLAALGAARLVGKEVDSLFGLQPLYVRQADAAIKPPRRAGQATEVGTEAIWSTEKRSSSGNI